MRIDLPCCNFKYCRRCFDGNCIADENCRKNCDYLILQEQQLNNGWIPEVMKEVLTEDAAKLLLNDRNEFKKWLERGIWNCKRLNELSNRNNGWIPADSKPDTYRNKYEELIPFLVCIKGTEYPFRAFFDGNKWGDGISKVNVIAWQPLPEPYKEESK